MILFVDLHFEQPVIATGYGGDANTNQTLPYLPGSLMRGAIIKRFLRANPETNLANDPEARAMFFDGGMRFLFGFPLDVNENSWLPTPLSLHYNKEGTGNLIHNFEAKAPQRDKSYNAVSEFYCAQTDKGIAFHDPVLAYSFHNTISNKEGRAPVIPDNLTRDEYARRSLSPEPGTAGAIYHHVAMAPNQFFRVPIRCSSEAMMNLVVTLLEDSNVWLGGDKKSGFGHCRVLQTIKLTDANQLWDRTGYMQNSVKHLPSVNPGEKFDLTLLSPALVHNKYGAFDASPESLLHAVASRLNIAVDSLTLEKPTFSRSTLVGGYNAYWGLPLPQVYGIAPGSVFKFKSAVDINEEQFSNLVNHGIGLRGAEGYGECKLNWKIKDETRKDSDTYFQYSKYPFTQQATDEPLPPAIAAQAQQLINTIFAERMTGELKRRINEYKLTSSGISANQLGKLRLRTRNLLLRMEQATDDTARDAAWESTKDELTTYTKSLQSRASTEAWSRSIVREGSDYKGMTLGWIKDRLHEDVQIWQPHIPKEEWQANKAAYQKNRSTSVFAGKYSSLAIKYKLGSYMPTNLKQIVREHNLLLLLGMLKKATEQKKSQEA